MKECSKAVSRRLHDPDFMGRFFAGVGLDIGGKPDPLSLYQELFPLISNVRVWDMEDGDAEHLAGVADASFDFVHSSHCLEHLNDVPRGLANWFRVLKPGGYLVVTVPDEDLYEQGVFPSLYNRDHKATFTIFKEHSWSSVSYNVVDLLKGLGHEAQTLKVELVLTGYRLQWPRFDQTLTPLGESSIEFVVRKRTSEEVERFGQLERPKNIDKVTRRYLNQYLADQRALRELARAQPPFRDESEI